MCMTQESTEASHLERGLDAMIRRRVESDFGEKHQGERNSRRDVRPETDGREDCRSTCSVALGFVDLENAFDSGLPREMAMTTLRWMEYLKRK